MTEDTTTKAEAEVTTQGEQSLAAKHLAFKENATRLLHEYGEDRGHCSTFDEVLIGAGIPARPRYDREYGYKPITLVGEDTEEEFAAWRANAAQELYDAALRHGQGDDAYDKLVEAGFTNPEYRRVRIEGRFSVPLKRVRVAEGQSLIDSVNTNRIELAESVYQAWVSDQDNATIEWKVVDADVAEAQDAKKAEAEDAPAS